MAGHFRVADIFLYILILGFFILFSDYSIADNTFTEFVINTTGKKPLNTPKQDGFMDLVAREAFSRIGVRLRTVQLPAERGLKNSNAGIEDGEMSRIAGLEKQYPNLIRVPEKIMDWEFVVFSHKPVDLKQGWQGLKSYSVSFINGWKILEKNVPTETTITRVKNPAQLFNLLQHRRVDLIIYERWGGLQYIKDLKLASVRMRRPALAVKNMYIYLNKRHKKFVPKLDMALKQMKQDGTYKQLVKQVLEPLN